MCITKGYVANITTSFLEIPGEICVSVYLSGCTFNCKGCQNPELQCATYGKLKTVDDVVTEINENKLAKWVCFLGGEPFFQSKYLFELCKKITKPIGIYTGNDFTFLTHTHKNIINIPNVNFLKVGRFEIENIIKDEFPITSNQDVYLKNNNSWEKCNNRNTTETAAKIKQIFKL